MEPRLLAALERWDCRNPRPLMGDAGNRQYFRVDHPQLGTAMIVLYAPQEPGKADDAYFDYRALQAYLDPVVRHGFVRGIEPVTYVGIILERYDHYRQFVTA